ncbi:MAG: bifunctional adenosylcobinamide kinase/adenosylcobinamide-phosphate guanylyltransferase [Actinomycetota bacterium]
MTNDDVGHESARTEARPAGDAGPAPVRSGGRRLTVLTGGARSGKSRLALDLAADAAGPDGPVVFVATCPRIDGDGDLARRIDAHRAERPTHWTTVESEVDLATTLAAADPEAVVVIDCLTLWVNNLLFRDHDEAAIVDAAEATLAAACARSSQTIAVTNEVGLGIVPGDELSRSYRDALGRVNQRWIAAADRALFLVAGRALALHDPRDLLA